MLAIFNMCVRSWIWGWQCEILPGIEKVTNEHCYRCSLGSTQSEGWYRKSERVLTLPDFLECPRGTILRSREKLAKKFPVNLKILAFSLPGKFYFRDQFQIMHNLGPQMSFSMVVCPLPGSRKWRTSTAMHIATYNIGILPVRCT